MTLAQIVKPQLRNRRYLGFFICASPLNFKLFGFLECYLNAFNSLQLYTDRTRFFLFL